MIPLMRISIKKQIFTVKYFLTRAFLNIMNQPSKT